MKLKSAVYVYYAVSFFTYLSSLTLRLFFGRTQAGWLRVNPWGLRSLLRWVRDRYNNPPLYVTENGRPTEGDSLEDDTRIEYYTSYVNEMLKGNNNIRYIVTTAQFMLFPFS